MTKTTLPFHNGHIKRAYDFKGNVIGVEVVCFYAADQISELPEPLLSSARRVFDGEN